MAESSGREESLLFSHEEGDAVTLALRRYEPFVEDPVIERVGKQEPTHRPEGTKPSPPTGEEGLK